MPIVYHYEVNESLVSIICLCYNQVSYVEEALQSVLNQTYENVELIVVDDASTDGSQQVIRRFLEHHPAVLFVTIEENIGNCAAFNHGWRMSKGEFLIDLAADDVLLPERVEVGVKRLEETKASVHFSNAQLIDVKGGAIGLHNDRFAEPIPEGDLYTELVRRYLICPPTMMFRREVIEFLGGYDESLAFEDFDFWVRSAREFQYAYSNHVLVKKRGVKNSHARSQEKFQNSHQRSILIVCEKILQMNRTKADARVLKKRCWHEIRQCIKKGHLRLIPSYLSIVLKA